MYTEPGRLFFGCLEWSFSLDYTYFSLVGVLTVSHFSEICDTVVVSHQIKYRFFLAWTSYIRYCETREQK